MQDEIRALLKRHCTTLNHEFDELCAALPPVPSPRADLSQAIAVTHKIKGSSGSIGFADISASAAQLEQALKQAALTGRELGAVAMKNLAELEALVRGATPEMSRLYNADFTRFTPL